MKSSFQAHKWIKAFLREVVTNRIKVKCVLTVSWNWKKTKQKNTFPTIFISESVKVIDRISDEKVKWYV